MSHYKLSLVEIENLGPIDTLRVDWQTGDILVFKGRNGTGKTTATSHLSQLLQNQSIPEPLKKGTEKGFFKAILKDGHGNATEILHKFDKDGETLTVIAPNGHAMGSSVQKTFLSRLAQDKRSFYIPDYLEVSAPQKRMEMILKLIPIELANIIANDSKALKDARDKRQSAFQSMNLQKGKAVVFDEAKATLPLVDAADLAAKKQSISDHNTRFERAKEKIGEFEASAKDWAAMAEKTRLEIERLQGVMAQQKQNEAAALEKVKAANDWLADATSQPRDTAEIDQQLSDLAATNQAIADAKRIKGEHAELDRLKAIWMEHDQKCKDAEIALRKKMTEAQLPAGLGIEIDDDAVLSLTLKGVPIEQSSSSERTISQLHLSLLSMGELGFIRFDGTLVDDSNMATVIQWLKDHDYQAAIEIMERSGAKTVTYEVADKYFDIGGSEHPQTLFPS